MADRLTIEHYIGEAFVKCGQVLLGSRILPSGPAQQPRPARDKRAGRWFLLELEEIDGVGKEVEQWRKDISTPLVVEIFLRTGGQSALLAQSARLAPAGPAAAAAGSGTGVGAGVAPEGGTAMPGSVAGETLLERWTLQYERAPARAAGGGGAGGNGAGPGGVAGGVGGGAGAGVRTYLDEVSIYKRLTILVRSLYSYARVLPAYKLFRAAKRFGGEHMQLGYRVLRSLQGPQQQATAAGAGTPPPRLHDFMFAPVDTPGGRFRVAVQYNPAAAALVLEQSTAPVAMPYTINENYLGPGGAVAAMGPLGGPGYPSPGTSAPPTLSGGFGRPQRPAMSASVYGSTAAAGRGAGGGGGAVSPAAPMAAPPRSIVRQCWSSKEMKVSFSLPPPLGSPGGPGLGGGGGAGSAAAAALFRRSSSGYGSTPSTTPLQSPVGYVRVPAGSAGGAPPPPAPHLPGATATAGAAASATASPRFQPPSPSHFPNQQHPHLTYTQYSPSGMRYTPGTSHPKGPLPPPPPSPSLPSSSPAAAAKMSSGSPGVLKVPNLALPPALAAAVAAAGSPATGTTPRSPCSASSAFAAAQCQRRQGSGTTLAASPPPGGVGEVVLVGGRGGGVLETGAATGSGADGPSGGVATGAGGRGEDGVVGRGGRGGSSTASGCVERGSSAAAAATSGGGGGGAGASLGTDRTCSAPVAIPSRSSSRTRSVNDLRAPAVYGGFEVHTAVAAAAASSSRTAAAAAAIAAAASSGGSFAAADPPSLDPLLAADASGTPTPTTGTGTAVATPPHHRMIPGSAPAAPRGMLGLALGALKPPAAAAAAAASATASGGIISDAASAGGAVRLPEAGAVSSMSARGEAATGGHSAAAAAVNNELPAATSGAVTDAGTARTEVAGAMVTSLSATAPQDRGVLRIGAIGTTAATINAANTAAAAAASCVSQALAVIPPHHQLQHPQMRSPHPHSLQPHPPPHPYQRQFSGPYLVIPAGSPPAHLMPMGSLPPYGSPQLPFAFTPSVQSMSLASLHQAMVPLGYPGGGPHMVGPPRAVSGRDITSLATICRPSWSSRSGSLDPSLASAGATGTLLMPSSGLFPLQDMFGCSLSPAGSSTPGGAGAHRPDSSGLPRSAVRRGRPHAPDLPSSSSASAIFSLSPNSAVPGSSPKSPGGSHGQQQQQHRHHPAGGTRRALVSQEKGGGGEGVGACEGGGGDGGRAGGRAAGDELDGSTEGDIHAAGAPSLTQVDSEDVSAMGGEVATAAAGSPSIISSATTTKTTTAGPQALGIGVGPVDHHVTGVPYDMYDHGPYVDGDGGHCALIREDSESDLLPFALDQDHEALGLVVPVVAGPPAGRAGRAGYPAAGPIELTLSLAHARERDVAVGAFVRLMAEAAPLAAPPGHPSVQPVPARQALQELGQLAAQIRAVLSVGGGPVWGPPHLGS